MQDAAKYAPDDLPDEIVVKDRGRTDFRPHFEWLDEQGIQPDVCLYFAVMVCPSYREAEPGFDKTWVNYANPPATGTASPGESASTFHRDEGSRTVTVSRSAPKGG